MFRREWVEIHICSSGENWLSNWQWRAVVRFANVYWGVGLGKEPWGARQTVKSWMLFAGLLFYCLFVQTKERHCLRCGPQFNAFVGVYQRKKLLTRKIFVKFSCRPCTDGEKVSFYKWGVKYRKRGQKMGKTVKGKMVWDREKRQIKKYEKAAKKGWFLKQVKKKS